MTAHADISIDLVRRLQEADDGLKADEVWALHYSDPNGNGEGKLWGEAAALIQQMDSELANCNEASSLKDAAIALNFQRAESAESQLADLRAKLAAADAGMPSEPIFIINYRLLSGPKTSALNDAIDYIDSILEVCRAQAVRIAELTKNSDDGKRELRKVMSSDGQYYSLERIELIGLYSKAMGATTLPADKDPATVAAGNIIARILAAKHD